MKLKRKNWHDKVHEIMFEANTTPGKIFEFILITCIILSVINVMLISVKSISQTHKPLLYGIEWGFTILFTIEYLLRLWCVKRHFRYATSFFGIIDLVAILPTYLRLLVPSAEFLIFIRILRVLRIFRLLKILQYLGEADTLLIALKESRRKIAVFLFVVISSAVILGSMMYIIEGRADSGFTSIPESVYWAIVTLTTVGYGDISPETPLGQFFASIIMLLGYSIIAVPTGIITVEFSRARELSHPPRVCPGCNAECRDGHASFCKFCGAKI